MALDPLATVADLSAYNVDTTNTDLVNALLSSVSEAVREAAGSPISSVASLVTLTGSPEPWLALPGGPVTEVDSVELDGEVVTDWRLRDGRLWRRCGWQSDCGPSDVEVVYTHGFATVPADIVRLVCMYVAAGVAQSASGYDDRSKAYERIDDYQVGFRQGGEEIVDHAELTPRTKADLAARFGGGAYVTGDY